MFLTQIIKVTEIKNLKYATRSKQNCTARPHETSFTTDWARRKWMQLPGDDPTNTIKAITPPLQDPGQ